MSKTAKEKKDYPQTPKDAASTQSLHTLDPINNAPPSLVKVPMGFVTPTALLVHLDFLRDLNLQRLGVNIGIALDNLLASFLLSPADVLAMTLLLVLKQWAVPTLATPVGIVKVVVVNRGLRADITLDVAAPGTRAPHLVAAVFLDEGGATCDHNCQHAKNKKHIPKLQS
jgi:hypothetical protein